MILITGASGKTGTEVARRVAAAGRPFRVLVRSPEKGAPLAAMGAELAVGDLADVASVRAALSGVDKAVLIMPNGEQQQAMETQFADLAVDCGVGHLVYLSSIESVPQNNNPITRMHLAVEDHIRRSRIDWTLIRPSFFMQIFLASAPAIRERGELVMPTGSGTVATTDLRDVAEVIELALSEPGHTGQSYELTGPELLTIADCAARFSRVLDREVRHVDQALTEFADRLRAIGLTEWRTQAVCKEFEAIQEGIIDRTTDTVQELLGRPPRSLEQFIADHVEVFRA
jgi:uncharacterized protein YbjT (DUF2867 family)